MQQSSDDGRVRRWETNSGSHLTAMGMGPEALFPVVISVMSSGGGPLVNETSWMMIVVVRLRQVTKTQVMDYFMFAQEEFFATLNEWGVTQEVRGGILQCN